MDVLPAKIAGVKKIVMMTPTDSEGNVPAAILAAASIAGVDEIYKVGGAHGVAALAYGTETIPKVDRLWDREIFMLPRPSAWFMAKLILI